MMMATFNKYTVVCTASSLGLIANEIANAVLAHTPGLSLYCVASETSSKFEAYYSVFGSNAVLLRIMSSSSSTVQLMGFYRSDAGTTSVNGELYAPSRGGASMSGLGIGAAFSLYSLVCDDALMVIGNTSASSSFYKVKNVDDGKILHVAADLRSTPYTYAADGEGNASLVNDYPIIQSAADTGYIRAVPVSMAASGAVPVAGYIVDPNILYAVYSGGTLLAATAWTELSIGGKTFVSVGDRGRFIRIS